VNPLHRIYKALIEGREEKRTISIIFLKKNEMHLITISYIKEQIVLFDFS